MKKILTLFALLFFSSAAFAAAKPSADNGPDISLFKQPGFFRFTFDNLKMPQGIENMGLLGINYYADITPWIYGGVGAFGAVSGSQGGLFVLGIGGGVHHEFAPHWWGDAGLFLGGGGGKSSLVGGGFMVRPQVGIQYDFNWARIGVHYSYINFPSGEISSSQIGLDFDIPCDFYYIHAADVSHRIYHASQIHLFDGEYLSYQRNDFALVLQAYDQKAGTLAADGTVQDGTIGLVGAELDHYFTERTFGFIKADGAFSGIPNGFMDVSGGLGYHWDFLPYGIALVPQFGVGAGGGGNVDTGGGVLIQPQLGLEIPLTTDFAARIGGGYLWAPNGQLKAYTGSAELIYHLDIASGTKSKPISSLTSDFTAQGWRVGLFNQTYRRPQRTHDTSTSADNLIVVQIDQLFTPNFYFSYQAASAFTGRRAGGLATGMIGPGLQTPEFHHFQVFGQLLVGAGGGGGLALGGGALVEPVLGLHYAFTQAFGAQASVSQVKAMHNNLNTPVFNIGFTMSFGTLNKA